MGLIASRRPPGRRWRGLPLGAALIAFTCSAMTLTATEARAAAIQYTTTGEVASYSQGDPLSTIGGPSVIHFESTSGTIEPGVPFVLGGIVVDRPPAGVTATYNKTPFELELHAPSLDYSVPASGPNDLPTEVSTSMIIRGYIDGTVTANGPPDLTLTIQAADLGSLRLFQADHIQLFTFPLATATMRFNATDAMTSLPQAHLAPGASMHLDPFGGAAGNTAYLVAEFVPEPSSLAIFGATTAVLALYARRRAR